MESNNLNTSLTFSESLNTNLQNQIRAEVLLREESISQIQKEMDTQLNKMKSRKQELLVEIDIHKAEIESLNDQLQQKAAFVGKIEQSFAADVTRLEKKIAQQTKLCDELTVENSNNSLQAYASLQKHHEEVRHLKQKMVEQQTSLDSISQFVDNQQKESDMERLMFVDDESVRDSNFQRSPALSCAGDYVFSTGSVLSNYRSSVCSDIGCDSPFDSPYRSQIDNFSSPRSKRKPQLCISTSIDEAIIPTPLPTHVSVSWGDNANSRISAPSTEKAQTIKQFHSHDDDNDGDNDVNDDDNEQDEYDYYVSEGNDLQGLNVDDLCLERFRYERVFYGLSLATSLLETNLQQDRQLRNFYSKSESFQLERLHETQFELEKTKENELQLTMTKSHLQDSFHFHQSMQSQLQNRINELETQISEHRNELYRVSKQEKVSSQQAFNLDGTLRENQSLLDKAKHDVVRADQETRDLRLEHFTTQGKLEESLERYSLLQTHCEVLSREKEFIQLEKDELVRKYTEILMSPTKSASRSTLQNVNNKVEHIEEDARRAAKIVQDGLDEAKYSPRPTNQDEVRSIVDKYRRSSRLSELSPAAFSVTPLNLSDSVSSRRSDDAIVNSLRTYALNTGETIDPIRAKTSKSQIDFMSSGGSSRYSPMKQRLFN
jgi:hypothetical protein